ncbi:hypothetical protein U1Q18_051672 [Sarracenia purpurea var. burkii]
MQQYLNGRLEDEDESGYVTQPDAYKCGVYVLWYVHQILKGEILTKSIDPQYFRKVILYHIFPMRNPDEVSRELKAAGKYPHPSATHQSGLINYPEYYRPSEEKKDYVVAVFKNLYYEPVIVTDRDFASLEPSAWLTGTTIDACLSADLNDFRRFSPEGYNQIKVFQSRFTSDLIGDPITTNIPFNKAIRMGLLPHDGNITKFLLPLNLSANHWTLLYIDIKEELLSYQYFKFSS